MPEWYFPWNRIDVVLRLEMAVWLSVVVLSYWIAWRTLVAKRPWLRKHKKQKP